MSEDILGFKKNVLEELDEVASELRQLEEVLDRIEQLKKRSESLESTLSRINAYISRQASKSKTMVESEKTHAIDVVRSLFDSEPSKSWLPKEIRNIVKTKIEEGEINTAGKSMKRGLVDNILRRLLDTEFIGKGYLDEDKKKSYYYKMPF